MVKVMSDVYLLYVSSRVRTIFPTWASKPFATGADGLGENSVLANSLLETNVPKVMFHKNDKHVQYDSI